MAEGADKDFCGSLSCMPRAGVGVKWRPFAYGDKRGDSAAKTYLKVLWRGKIPQKPIG